MSSPKQADTTPNTQAWRANIISLMPQIYPGPLAHSIIGDAHTRGLWHYDITALRDFGIGKHQQVDDTPYGGGAGMVIKPEVADAAITHAKAASPDAQLIHFTPRGEPLCQQHFITYAQKPVILFCARYEGLDERVIEKHRPHEISLGDYVITGGDLAAMIFIEGCVRLLPNVVGDTQSLNEESFGLSGVYQHLLEYPHYTKPAHWDGRNVPDILTTGHHANIEKWRLEQAEATTKARRSDVWARYQKQRNKK
jgi:tRNA (guanine37-N1)-methyltransferase